MRVAVIMLLLTPTPSYATSYAPPERHDVFSPNGLFVLDVDPKTENHTVYKVGDRAKPLWSFSKRVWHYPFLLANDGSVVATLAWEHVRVDDLDDADCVQFWKGSGIFKSYTFAQLCPAPARTSSVGVGPVGVFWRTWYTDLQQDGDTFRVRTTDLFEYTFSLANGSITRRRLVPSNLLYKPWLSLGLLGGMVIVAAMVVWSSRQWWRSRGLHVGE